MLVDNKDIDLTSGQTLGDVIIQGNAGYDASATTLTSGTATPSVRFSNSGLFSLVGISTVNLTDFLDGDDGDVIYIVGNGTTTMGTNIIGQSTTLATNDVAAFKRIAGKWYKF